MNKFENIFRAFKNYRIVLREVVKGLKKYEDVCGSANRLEQPNQCFKKKSWKIYYT